MTGMTHDINCQSEGRLGDSIPTPPHILHRNWRTASSKHYVRGPGQHVVGHAKRKRETHTWPEGSCIRPVRRKRDEHKQIRADMSETRGGHDVSSVSEEKNDRTHLRLIISKCRGVHRSHGLVILAFQASSLLLYCEALIELARTTR
jgi:hypothetical protein